MSPGTGTASGGGGLTEAVRYFRQRPLERVLAALRGRYESLGRVGGRVRLALTEEERLALRDFLGIRGGRSRRLGPELTLDVARFDAILRASRFACSLPQLLEAYFDGPLLTRPARREARAAAWERLLQAIQAEAEAVGSSLAGRWAAALREGRAAHSLGWLRRTFEEGDEAPAAAAGDGRGPPAPALAGVGRVVARALASLPALQGANESLPVFAARLTGDPHGLDPDREVGRLLERALADLQPELGVDLAGIDSPAMRREALLAAAGLARDDLSSTVLAANLGAATLADGRSDPLVAGARQAGVPVGYPLRVVRRWAEVASSDASFIVENPSVFGTLVERCRQRGGGSPTLVCTAGQPSLAAYELLDRLARAGVTLRYSGDFDVSGVLIARALKLRYGARLELWRMGAADYRRALSRSSGSVPLSVHEKRRLRALLDAPNEAGLGELDGLVEAMLAAGRKAFQEHLLPELEADVADRCRQLVPDPSGFAGPAGQWST